MTDMNTIEGTDGKYGRKVAVIFGDAVIGLHPEEKVIFIAPSKDCYGC
jgi:hypothetical protein